MRVGIDVAKQFVKAKVIKSLRNIHDYIGGEKQLNVNARAKLMIYGLIHSTQNIFYAS